MGLLRRIFDRDPEAKTTTIYHEEPDGGFTLETLQDVEDVLEKNKMLYNDVDERARWGEKWHTAASVPLVIWMQWMKEGDVNDPNFIRKKLNDPEWLHLRTRPGRL